MFFLFLFFFSSWILIWKPLFLVCLIFGWVNEKQKIQLTNTKNCKIIKVSCFKPDFSFFFKWKKRSSIFFFSLSLKKITNFFFFFRVCYLIRSRKKNWEKYSKHFWREGRGLEVDGRTGVNYSTSDKREMSRERTNYEKQN